MTILPEAVAGAVPLLKMRHIFSSRGITLDDCLHMASTGVGSETKHARCCPNRYKSWLFPGDLAVLGVFALGGKKGANLMHVIRHP